ncbi:hypothetical protein [Ancylobacter terrae]|uniref:hypothetical protein n=1 Tax=Ancylobacter sp. sgz301288 TaxID=3342077 RepID=UPI00385E0F51
MCIASVGTENDAGGSAMADRERWIALIKSLREAHGAGLLAAERIALADPGWRRWVARQINTDQRCRKAALAHMKANGADALIYWDDAILKVRD